MVNETWGEINYPFLHFNVATVEIKENISYYIPHFIMDVIDQSHRYGRYQAACREPAGSYDKTTRTAICFEHKTQYFLNRAPYTRIVVFWHISNIPPMISQS